MSQSAGEGRSVLEADLAARARDHAASSLGNRYLWEIAETFCETHLHTIGRRAYNALGSHLGLPLRARCDSFRFLRFFFGA